MGAIARSIGIAVTAALLAGCAGDGPMTTSAILGTGAAKAPADLPTERALLAATTAARATRCGFYFEPAKYRASYLAYETTQGTPPDQLSKAEKSYDFTEAAVSKRIVKAEEYCSEAKTQEIKRDLNRRLAGDFSVPPKPAAPPKSASWWYSDAPVKPLDREEIFNPRSAR